MLNAVFSKNGEQKILNSSGIPSLRINDLTGYKDEDLERELIKVRTMLSHRVLDVENGKTAGLELSLLPDSKTRLHFDLDLLVADAMSLQILLRDLKRFYLCEEKTDKIYGFRFDDYLRNENASLEEERKKAKEYWFSKLGDLPKGPGLPLLKRPQEIKKPQEIIYAGGTFLLPYKFRLDRWKLILLK